MTNTSMAIERHPIPLAGTEVDTLLGALDRNRRVFAWKCGGLDAAGTNTHLGTSTVTLGGLLKHLALVEDHWFSHTLHGRPSRSTGSSARASLSEASSRYAGECALPMACAPWEVSTRLHTLMKPRPTRGPARG